MSRRTRRAAVVSLAMFVMIVLFPAVQAMAQYPPPTPTPTTSPTFGIEIECTVEAGPDFLIIRCTGAGFLPGSEVLAQIFGVGCNVGTAHTAAGIQAAPLPGEELLVTLVLTADENGDVALDASIPCCDLTAIRVLLTGINPNGDPVELEQIIDDVNLLECASLSETGFDWIRWLAVGLLLVTAGAWIANVRDERALAAA